MAFLILDFRSASLSCEDPSPLLMSIWTPMARRARLATKGFARLARFAKLARLARLAKLARLSRKRKEKDSGEDQK
eukprot:scaffold5102_cov267-Pinguiococcus_pyrenoidosus.AAC.3